MTHINNKQSKHMQKGITTSYRASSSPSTQSITPTPSACPQWSSASSPCRFTGRSRAAFQERCRAARPVNWCIRRSPAGWGLLHGGTLWPGQPCCSTIQMSGCRAWMCCWRSSSPGGAFCYYPLLDKIYYSIFIFKCISLKDLNKLIND